MFKFDFEIDDTLDDIAGLSFVEERPPLPEEQGLVEEPYQDIPLQHLIDCLPPLISCSPLTIPLSSGEIISIPRRDLFDARFQVINEEDSDNAIGKDAADFLDAPSDLVHGVYEGGLKTWECSLDLVDYLAGNMDCHPAGKRILEIGCGTAVPSLYLIRTLFSGPRATNPTEIHLQDYNASVLELITCPNIVVAWYMSDASKPYRESAAPLLDDPEAELPPADPSSAADIPITPKLKAAFLASLKEYSINLRFSSGSWRTLIPDHRYDVVLTSETIYRSESVPPLVALLKSSCCPNTICLVAAKVFYFGVGGGIAAFIKAVKESSGDSKAVWERNAGVGRKILRIHW
ncbi:hypothetical protein CPB85DRAFT_1377111 [Mucidula mucida]|nr:hypothetical protein CPB85DRAFT_1377111 [Mucidula mucida]